MFERFSRKSMAATGATLLAAFGISGVAIAQSGGASSEKPGVESNAPENSARDGDNVQYTPPGESNGKAAAVHSKRSNATHSSRTKSAKETPGTEQSPASEQSSGEAPGSETANNDGPGGHADEPGNANADHQFQGNE